MNGERYAEAINLLQGLLQRVDGVDEPAKDWMFASVERDLIAAGIVTAIAVLELL